MQFKAALSRDLSTKSIFVLPSRKLRLEWESLVALIGDIRSTLRRDGAEIGVRDPQELTRLRQQLRKAIELENGTHIQLRLHKLEVSMEWVYSCIEQDIRDSMSGPTELRLLVAEFGVLDQQLQVGLMSVCLLPYICLGVVS